VSTSNDVWPTPSLWASGLDAVVVDRVRALGRLELGVHDLPLAHADERRRDPATLVLVLEAPVPQLAAVVQPQLPVAVDLAVERDVGLDTVWRIRALLRPALGRELHGGGQLAGVAPAGVDGRRGLDRGLLGRGRRAVGPPAGEVADVRGR
jgi:hypothetical protein